MSANPAEIEALVRQIVTRTLGNLSGQIAPAGEQTRTLIGEEQVRQVPSGSTFTVPAGALVTPLARQVALERRVKLVEESGTTLQTQPTVALSGGHPLIALGVDHGGYQMKEQLKATVQAAGYSIIDCGAYSTEAVDYPDFAYAVAQLVASGRAWRGIIVDGAGIGSCMAANKVPGVRAAMCYDQATAVNSRKHNDANVLTLGAGLIGPGLAQQIVSTWLSTEFGGGRHARRVAKIEAIEKRFVR